MQSKFRETNTVADRPRALRQDRTIRLMHLQNHLKIATRTASEIPGRNRPVVSRDTVLSRLRGFEIRCRRPFVRLFVLGWTIFQSNYGMIRQ